MTHVVQKFVEPVDRLVSVRWEFSLRAVIELTRDLKFCYYLIYSFLLTSFNQLYQRIIILPQLRLFRRVFSYFQRCRLIGVFNNVTETYIVGKMALPFLAIKYDGFIIFLLLHAYNFLSSKIQKKQIQINCINSFSSRFLLLPHFVIYSVSYPQR